MPSIPPPPPAPGDASAVRARPWLESLSSWSERKQFGAFATTIRLLFVSAIVVGLLWLLK